MAGRKQKPYQTSWREPIPGLARDTDGRWRIVATGFKFTEPDEIKAINRFRAATSKPEDQVRVGVPVATLDIALRRLARHPEDSHRPAPTVKLNRITGDVNQGYDLEADIVWPWVREQFEQDPGYVARMIGHPELANPRLMQPATEAVSIARLVDAYREQNPSTAKAKKRCIQIFEQMVEATGAKTLDDLTQDALLRYRKGIETSKDIGSAGTKVWMYGRVKSVIAFGKKAGIDSDQIRACLDRCSILWTPDAPPDVKPQPISREDFHNLLAKATPSWRAWLLLGLNAAMYIEELSALEWKIGKEGHVDLAAKTLAMVRVKTRRKRIPRAATLWPETIEAINALPKGPKYVFTSSHGTRYVSSQSRANDFAELRTKAEISADVSFSHIRDGAFTTACKTTDTRLAKILAGHSCGMEDAYVLRNPEIVRPACDAVYAHYGPFPLA